jgi:hypothetical protein
MPEQHLIHLRQVLNASKQNKLCIWGSDAYPVFDERLHTSSSCQNTVPGKRERKDRINCSFKIINTLVYPYVHVPFAIWDLTRSWKEKGPYFENIYNIRT